MLRTHLGKSCITQNRLTAIAGRPLIGVEFTHCVGTHGNPKDLDTGAVERKRNCTFVMRGTVDRWWATTQNRQTATSDRAGI
eukprot:m.1375001 g.1375001  ORF g.1375001 m.1375001 type:complete len:82 (-) comp24960_c1_seq34:1575-1820(-)